MMSEGEGMIDRSRIIYYSVVETGGNQKIVEGRHLSLLYSFD